VVVIGHETNAVNMHVKLRSKPGHQAFKPSIILMALE
jgi:hypothetical protein